MKLDKDCMLPERSEGTSNPDAEGRRFKSGPAHQFLGLELSFLCALKRVKEATRTVAKIT